MSEKLVTIVARHAEPTIEEEIGVLGDDDVMDHMNLGADRTGIDGTIFVSTVMGRHGPRVKYFEKTGKGQPSFSVSISLDPVVLSSSLPDRVVNRVGPLVIEWVRMNFDALSEFWRDGAYWPEDGRDAFRDGLKKLPAHL